MEASEKTEVSKTAKRNYVFLCLTVFMRFLGDSFFYGFLYRYIATRELGTVEMSLLTAMIPFMAVVGNLLISKISTKFRSRRRTIIVYSILEPLCIMIFGFRTEFAYILILDIICNLCSNPFYNTLDTFIIQVSNDAKKSYSSGRVFGTVSYIFGILIGGYLISYIDYPYTFLIGGALMMTTLIFFLQIRFPAEEISLIEKEEGGEKTDEKSQWKELANKDYILFAVAAALILGSIWGGDNFYQQMTKSYSSQEYAYSYDAAIVAEAVGHLICSRFKSMKALRRVLYLSAVFLLIRYGIFAIPNLNKYVYLSAESLRGFTFSFCVGANLNLLGHILSMKSRNKGYFLLVALDELIAAVINLLGPFVMQLTGNNYIFPFSVLAGNAAVAMILLSFVHFNPEKVGEERISAKNGEEREAA